MMRYTTGWARVKTAEDYAAWLAGLKSQDRVIFQEFVERGKSCLDSQVEGWGFTQGRVVQYPSLGWGFIEDGGGENRQLKDGGAIYHGGAPWGNVFQARIVPDHHDLHGTGKYMIGHAPAYEPALKYASRCFAFAAYAPNAHKQKRLLREAGALFYAREVDRGELLTMFGDAEELRLLVEAAGAQWLYIGDLG
jgi:hypothetical protein